MRQQIELTLSHYLSAAAYHQSLAFKYTSERSIKRHARLAEHWYRCAELERKYMLLPGYKPNSPFWAQPEYVQEEIERLERMQS